jgi:hypothetical protein
VEVACYNSFNMNLATLLNKIKQLEAFITLVEKFKPFEGEKLSQDQYVRLFQIDSEKAFTLLDEHLALVLVQLAGVFPKKEDLKGEKGDSIKGDKGADGPVIADILATLRDELVKLAGQIEVPEERLVEIRNSIKADMEKAVSNIKIPVVEKAIVQEPQIIEKTNVIYQKVDFDFVANLIENKLSVRNALEAIEEEEQKLSIEAVSGLNKELTELRKLIQNIKIDRVDYWGGGLDEGEVVAIINKILATLTYVIGPESSTDTAIARFDGVTGKRLQDSPVTLSDDGDLSNVNSIKYDTSPTTPVNEVGSTQWNANEDTLDVHGTNITYQIGQELSPLYKNQTGASIPNGKPVMFDGALGASGRIKVKLAIADGTIPPHYTVGITTEAIADAADGHVTWFGKVRGIDTTGAPYGETWNDGDILYISPTTPGGLTKIKPNTPDLIITIAVVLNAHAVQGTLFVRPTWGFSLRDLDDVNGTPLNTTGQFPVYDDALGMFDFNYNINDYQKESEKGVAGGYAELDGAGKVPSAQLPSFVDDVLEYANFAALPVTGESGKIYITIDDGKTYRWGGSVYVEISQSLALGETSTTAYRGDRGKTAYDHSQTSGNPHGTTAAQVGADPVGTAAAEVSAHEGEADPHPQYMPDGSRAFGITIDGGGSVITIGQKGFVTIPFKGTITKWDIFADQPGDIVIDVWKDTYANFPPTVADSIAGTEKPTLSASQKNQDATLSTWVTAVNAGEIVGFNVDSVATVERVTLIVWVTPIM